MRSYLRSFTTRQSGVQIARLGIIGVINTIVDYLLFNIARLVLDMPRTASITVAFGIATLLSYVLNRRWTFGLTSNMSGVRETSIFFLVNIVAWAVTVAVVNLADVWFGPLTVLGENVAKLAAAILILIPKFASYRDVVFRRALRSAAAESAPAGPSSEILADGPHAGEGSRHSA